MSVDTPSTRSTRKANSDAKFVEYDDYIDTHIRNTRRAVKLIDLATALVLLTTGLLSYLLVAAVAEHWLVPGGYPPAVRMLLFALLVGGAGYFAYRNLWPLCWRAINPVYAAQAIEQNSPSLKNSLINFLLFRQRRTDISDAVYHTLEEQAAQRLTRVPMDGAVDRSLLIRFGYVLIGIVAIAALYKVLSPKDPLVSAERVLMPWADIVPASRVTIRAVEPGIATVSRGESLDVSADIRGIEDDDPVRLLFTTDDGQTVDKPIAMRLSSDGLRFEGRLPDNARGAEQVGLTRNLTYRIEAGDARSLDYPVTVVAAPTLLVKRIDYDYPAYTGFVDRQADDLGDIRAIEGTRITIHARANDPIKQAHVDFDADGRRDLDMKASEQQATATFELSLRDDRHTPTHASYVLRFTNTEGRTNRDPVKHSINVDPDQSPEAAIVSPQERLVDVRLDDKVEIEAESSDPDFKLSAVRLRGEVAGRLAIDEPLLAAEHRGRFTGKYTFAPSAHKLQAGEILDYWVEASDNRVPKANVTASDHKQIRIASPQPNQQPSPDQVAQNDRQPKDGQQQQDQPGQQGEQKDSGGNNSKGGEQQPGGATGKSPSDNSEGKNGEQQQSGNQPSNGDKNQSPSRDAKRNAGQGQGDKETGRQGEKQSGDQKNEKSDGKAGEGKSGEKNQQSDTAKAGDQKSPQDSNDKQTGAGAAGGESSKGESQPDGARPDAQPGQQQQSGNGQSGKQQSGESAKESPVSSQGDNDAEAFQRIREHMKRQGELKDDNAKPSEDQNNTGNDNQPFSRDAKQSEKQGQGDKETGKQEESNGPTQQQKEGEQKSDAKGDQHTNPADQKQNAKPSDEKNSQEQPGNTNSDQAKGSGASTRKDDTGKAKEPAGEKPDDSQSPGGEQTASKGSSGAGEEQKDSVGSPNSQPNMKPTEKREQSPSGDEQSKSGEPPAGARGKKESDSQGEQGGDKPGGGEEGGGQKSPHDGTGSAGQNQSADEGAGQSGEQGTGKNSSNAGKDATSDKRTGQPGGETHGRGNKTREGEGDKSGGKSGAENDSAGKADQTSGEQGKKTSDGDKKQPSDPSSQQPPNSDAKQSAEQGKTDKETGRQGDNDQGKQGSSQDDKKGDQQQSPQGDKADQSKGGDSENNPGNKGSSDGKQPSEATGGGQNGTGASGEPPQIEGTAPEGDAANLDYARKQTDLVLDKLASQVNTKKVDERLLKELGWTEDDLRKFVARWQSRKAAAERDDASGENARRELDDALRSLGLRPGALKQGPVKDDTMRDLHEGYHGPVPQKYRDQLRAYNEGVSRARQNGE